MRSISLTALIFLLCSCAQIETYEQLDVALGEPNRISIGEELFRIKKSRDLPNVFGKADVWGGKVAEGFSELRFMGYTESGEISFRYSDIDVESNETVFTRYGTKRANINTNSRGSASVVGDSVYGNSTTNTSVTLTEPPKATITQLPPGTVEFSFNPSEKVLDIGDYKIEIIEAKKYSLTYRITQAASN